MRDEIVQTLNHNNALKGAIPFSWIYNDDDNGDDEEFNCDDDDDHEVDGDNDTNKQGWKKRGNIKMVGIAIIIKMNVFVVQK